MRTTRTTQTSLFDPTPVDHPVADDMERVSGWLDALPELADEVAADLGAGPGNATGRHGLSCEAVLRCALLDPKWAAWHAEVAACDALLARVVDQTRRRVLGGETVPAQEKVVSLFEPHTDIIVKGGRGTHYGHKVNLATGRSGWRWTWWSRTATRRTVPGACRCSSGTRRTTARYRPTRRSTAATPPGATWRMPRRSAWSTPCSTGSATSSPRT